MWRKTRDDVILCDCYISDVSWRKEETIDSSRQLKEGDPPGQRHYCHHHHQHHHLRHQHYHRHHRHHQQHHHIMITMIVIIFIINIIICLLYSRLPSSPIIWCPGYPVDCLRSLKHDNHHDNHNNRDNHGNHRPPSSESSPVPRHTDPLLGWTEKGKWQWSDLWKTPDILNVALAPTSSLPPQSPQIENQPGPAAKGVKKFCWCMSRPLAPPLNVMVNLGTYLPLSKMKTRGAFSKMTHLRGSVALLSDLISADKGVETKQGRDTWTWHDNYSKG